MLKDFLKGAIHDIRTLIEITSKDIADIKEAKHNELFKRNRDKDELIASFENKKMLIDSEISKMAKKNPDKKPDEFLDNESREFLQELQTSLLELKKINKKYAKMVLAVSEFYNSLLDRLIPRESSGYQDVNRKASFIKIEA